MVSRPSAERVYVAAFDQFAALVTGQPAQAALKIQLLHYLPDSTFGSRDVLGWTLTGALVGLLAHLTGGADAQNLYRTRVQGMAALGPMLSRLVEPWDELILAHTATTGWNLVSSEPVAARINFWELHDGRKFEAWTNAAKTSASIRRSVTKPPLDDPHFREAARIMIGELKVLLKRLRSQSMVNQKLPDLVLFFEQEAQRGEFSFLSDRHNLSLWLAFVRQNPGVFLTQAKSPGAIFDLFQSSVSQHDPDYVRQKRSRA